MSLLSLPRVQLPSLLLGVRIFGATLAPKLLTIDPSVLAEVVAVPALTVVPAMLNDHFLLEQGERVVEWLANQVNGDALRKAWVAVSRMLAARAAEVLNVLKSHPYVATFGIVVVVGAFLVCLLRRKVEDFMACTQAVVDLFADDTECFGVAGRRAEPAPPREEPRSSVVPVPDVAWPSTVPQHFVCPITLEVMRDPCITPSGNSYDRAALEAWITVEGTEPETQLPLSPDQVFPNRGLKNAIEAWQAEMRTAAGAATTP